MGWNGKNALVVGGTRGIGGRIAEQLLSQGYRVIITGTKAPDKPALVANDWVKLDLHTPNLRAEITAFVRNALPQIDTFVYAAGFEQVKHIKDLTDDELDEMDDLCSRAPLSLYRDILRKQERIRQLVVISSTSQWTPRYDEMPYNVGKGGLGMFARSAAMDADVEQVILIAPSATWTAFWKKVPGKDPKVMLKEDRAGDLCAQLMKLRSRFIFAMLARKKGKHGGTVVLERRVTLRSYLNHRREPV